MTTENVNSTPYEEALEELQAGHIIIVTDDPDRENEGDFICAAQYCTTENMNFMASHGKGLICMPMSIEYAHKLGLPQMVSEIQTTMKQPSPFPSTTSTRRRAFPLSNAP